MDVSEEGVLEIVLTWLSLDSATRMAHAHRLLRAINFDRIHPAHVRSVLERQQVGPRGLRETIASGGVTILLLDETGTRTVIPAMMRV